MDPKTYSKFDENPIKRFQEQTILNLTLPNKCINPSLLSSLSCSIDGLSNILELLCVTLAELLQKEDRQKGPVKLIQRFFH